MEQAGTGGLDQDADWVERVRAALGAWYDRGHRELPWREERDAYRVLVSETMLVQTTVAAVAPYYERFLARFPTVEALAAADEADVVKAWEGLGYYRRARQLHAAARAIVERHGGRVPEEVDALRALPGVGPYIAGAVLSFAFDRPAPILEANTQRVLARLLAWEGDLRSGATQRRLWEAAERLVPAERPGRFNQALMDLGALICTVRTPRCLACPVASACAARSQGIQDRLPLKTAAAAPEAVEEACAIVERAGAVLVVRRAPGGLWEGFWEFPTVHVSGPDPAGRGVLGAGGLGEGVRRASGLEIEVGEAVHQVRFGVTRYRVTLRAHRGTALAGRLRPGPGLDEVRWERPENLAALTMGSAQRRMVAWYLRVSSD